MSSFEEAFDVTGHGIFNHLALLTNGSILLYVTVECLGLGYVLNQASCDLHVNTEERGSIAGATFIGVVTPAIVWGYLADTYGRRRVMLPATMLAVLCSLLSSLSVDVLSMYWLRILTGTMVSASCATTYVYLGELTTPAERVTSIAWLSIFIAVSYFFMPGFAWILLPQNFSGHVAGRLSIVPWRVLMWSHTIWGIAACVGMCVLPDSPSFLLVTKGGPATLAVLARIYSWNKGTKADEYPIKELIVPTVAKQTFKEHIIHMKYLFKPPLLKCLLISHICNFVVYMQSNTFNIWMPHILDELLKHTPTHPHRSLCQTMNDVHESVRAKVLLAECSSSLDPLLYPISMILFLPTSAAFVAVRFAIKRWRKTIIYSVIMNACAIFLLLAAFVPSTIAAIVFYIPGICGIAANTVLAGAVVEVFPTSLRALAMCTLFMVGRLGSAVGMHILAWGLTHNCAFSILLINILAMVTGPLLCLWPDSEKTRAAMMAQDFTY